ncbi:hypothetical protein CDAR_297221 [Caerostris darwini]|uniref:Uncharacterized protein n=1 Tax=Caerostris darwini TaxID=1538125 RepID=A0AAV4PPR1_9ARAC|nr:hypothetical protein CDAR_297221 [Caerostris darwini]
MMTTMDQEWSILHSENLRISAALRDNAISKTVMSSPQYCCNPLDGKSFPLVALQSENIGKLCNQFSMKILYTKAQYISFVSKIIISKDDNPFSLDLYKNIKVGRLTYFLALDIRLYDFNI